VRAFDVLQPGQPVALLALAGTALSDPNAPALPRTAATEGAVAAVLAQVRTDLEMELDAGDSTECRRLILASAGDVAGRDGPLPEPTDPDPDEWETLIQEAESRPFWDADWGLADASPDLPPGAARADMVLHGIDPDYFTAVPDDPDLHRLEVARRTLAGLTGQDGDGNRHR
jgi:hypothetical protein